jgi:hypothetical protein
MQTPGPSGTLRFNRPWRARQATILGWAAVAAIAATDSLTGAWAPIRPPIGSPNSVFHLLAAPSKPLTLLGEH